MDDGIEEFATESGVLLLVPQCGGGKFFAGCFEVSWGPSQRPRISVAIRRLAFSQDSSRSVPTSSAFTRRSISSAHAVAASGSEGPSRLASNSAANSARAFSSNRRASARRDSVAFVIALFYAAFPRPTRIDDPRPSKHNRTTNPTCPKTGSCSSDGFPESRRLVSGCRRSSLGRVRQSRAWSSEQLLRGFLVSHYRKRHVFDLVNLSQ